MDVIPEETSTQEDDAGVKELKKTITPDYNSPLKPASFRRKPAFAKVVAQIEDQLRNHDQEQSPWISRVGETKTQFHYAAKRIQWRMGSLGLPWVASEDEVRDQAAVFCKEFIHAKLKRLGYLMGGNPPTARNGTVRTSISARGHRASAVCREMQLLGAELERLYPALYRDITKQLNVNITSDSVAEQILYEVADAILKTGITWAKVVSLFVVASSLSVECMQQGNGIFVHSITMSLTSYVQTKLVKWIARRGGWADILRVSHPKKTDWNMVWAVTIGGAILASIFSVFVSRTAHAWIRLPWLGLGSKPPNEE